MSVFVVSDRTIAAILMPASRVNDASYYYKGAWHSITPRLTECAHLLLNANIRSELYRYGNCSQRDPWEDPHLDPLLAPVQSLRCMDCYEYQSDEHPTWPESEAHALLYALREMAIRQLPGYSACKYDM